MRARNTESPTLIRVDYEDHPDPEQRDHCPGYRRIRRPSRSDPRREIDALARCNEPHPHLERLQVERWSDGTSSTTTVRAYGTGRSWGLSRRPRTDDHESDWGAENGLDERRGEAVKGHAARCLAFMVRRIGGNLDESNVLAGIARAADLSLDDVRGVAQERLELELTESDWNARIERLRGQAAEIEGVDEARMPFSLAETGQGDDEGVDLIGEPGEAVNLSSDEAAGAQDLDDDIPF